MKKQLTLLALIVFAVVGKISAQHTPIVTTGYNLDAVAEATLASNTTSGALDGSSYIMYSQAYGSMVGSSYGLPNSGLISSGTRTFQLRPYTGTNVLYIPWVSTATLSADSLTLPTPAPYISLSLLGFSTEGSSNMAVKVRFTDGTTQSFTGLTMPDWFGSGNTALSGFDRANQSTGTPDLNGSNPKLFYTDLAITCANQGKLVQRVVVIDNGPTSSGQVRICVMGLSGISPSYSAAASPTVTCGAANVTLTANGMTSYSWAPTGTFAGSNSTMVVVSPTTTTTYTLNGTTSSGCPGVAQLTIYAANGTPTLNTAGSSSSVCLGGAATLMASGAITYTFSNGIANSGTFAPTSTASYTISGTNGCGTSSTVVAVSVSPLPITAVASSTLICAGSPATLTAGGGTTYSWTPSSSTATNLVINPNNSITYTLQGFTAGNCRGSVTIAVSTKPNPTLTIVATNTSICAGDSNTLTVLGNALSYTWNPGGQVGNSIVVNPGQTSLYTAVGTDTGNCTSSSGFPVLVYPNPTITANASNYLVCPNDTTILSASGASSYVWNGSVSSNTFLATPPTDATYTVTGTSSVGCVGTTTVMINVFAPSIIVSSNTTICKGANAGIGAGPADSWSWSNGSTFQNITVSPTLTTVYTVTASVNNLNGLSCDATNTVMVTVNALPSLSVSASRGATICTGNSAVLTASGAITYTWTGGAGAVMNASTTVSPISNQNYTVSGTDANGCKSSAVFNVVVSPCTGIATNAASNSNLLIYPNPNNGNFTVSYDQTIVLNVLNELGQQVGSVTLDNSNDHKAVIENLPSGIYFVRSADAANALTQKVIITK